MNISSLEITEQEYCIKLSRKSFDLSLVHQLIRRIQAEALFFNKSNPEEEDILSIRAKRDDFEGFDYLGEK